MPLSVVIGGVHCGERTEIQYEYVTLEILEERNGHMYSYIIATCTVLYCLVYVQCRICYCKHLIDFGSLILLKNCNIQWRNSFVSKEIFQKFKFLE